MYFDAMCSMIRDILTGAVPFRELKFHPGTPVASGRELLQSCQMCCSHDTWVEERCVVCMPGRPFRKERENTTVFVETYSKLKQGNASYE